MNHKRAHKNWQAAEMGRREAISRLWAAYAAWQAQMIGLPDPLPHPMNEPEFQAAMNALRKSLRIKALGEASPPG